MSRGEKKSVLLYQRARTTRAVSSIVFLLIIHLFLFVLQYVLNYIYGRILFFFPKTYYVIIYICYYFIVHVSVLAAELLYIYTLQNRIVSICRFWIE